MANADVKGGFKVIGTKAGGPYTGRVTTYKKEASTIIAVGDPVVRTGNTTTDGKYELVDRAAASGTITGIVVGIEPNRDNLSRNYMAAADTGLLLVADDPNLLCEIQEDSVGGALAATAGGNTIDIIVANANTTTGISQVMLDSNTVGTGANVKLLCLANREDNELGNYAKWIVRINEHTDNAASTAI